MADGHVQLFITETTQMQVPCSLIVPFNGVVFYVLHLSETSFIYRTFLLDSYCKVTCLDKISGILLLSLSGKEPMAVAIFTV